MPIDLKPQQLMMPQRGKKKETDEPEKSVEQERKERIEAFLKSQKEREEKTRKQELEAENEMRELEVQKARERAERKDKLQAIEDKLKSLPISSWPKEVERRLHLCYATNTKQTICGQGIDPNIPRELAPICEECFNKLIDHKADIVEKLWKIKD